MSDELLVAGISNGDEAGTGRRRWRWLEARDFSSLRLSLLTLSAGVLVAEAR